MSSKEKDKGAFLEELIAFIQNKGFVWGPFPEIYGGFSGFYAYGPLGKLLKNKVENSVRRVFQKYGFWELECPIVLPNIVWKASGHLDTFVDRAISCSKCKGMFRADKLIEEQFDVVADSFSDQQLLNFIQEKRMRCPSCKGEFTYDIVKENLMMQTRVGGVDASLRPETATVTYLPFKRYYEFFRKKLPIGVFQIGKAFRNEISPRQHMTRSREFTQAEGQLFVDPKEKGNWERFDDVKKDRLPLWTWQDQKAEKQPIMMTLDDALKKKFMKQSSYAWCVWLAYQQFVGMGIHVEKIRIRQHHPDERAFYADDAWDIEVQTNSFGWMEMCGVHDRTDYDLVQHEKFSKQNLQATREDGSKVHPHVLEIAFGIDRPVFALLDLFYSKIEKGEGKTIFKVPYHLAPVDVAIFPLMKKEGMPELAQQIKEKFEHVFVVEYDDGGSIGRRYLRAAEGGTPYCLTVDYDSLKNKDITIRDRDSEQQIRVKIDALEQTLHKLLNKELRFEKAGTLIK